MYYTQTDRLTLKVNNLFSTLTSLKEHCESLSTFRLSLHGFTKMPLGLQLLCRAFCGKRPKTSIFVCPFVIRASGRVIMMDVTIGFQVVIADLENPNHQDIYSHSFDLNTFSIRPVMKM